MKITVPQYAKALYESTKDKSHSEVSFLAANFIKILARNKQLKIAGNIIESFSKLHDEKNGIVEARVLSANPLDSETIEAVKGYVSNKYFAKEVILKNEVDKRLKGGLIIWVGDEMLDSSVAGRIAGLRKKMMQ